jgi:hypothetical protein
MADARELKAVMDGLGLPNIRGLVPGHAILGKGFNVFGRYNASSARATLFDTTIPALRVWRDAQSDFLYIVPQNVDDPIEVGSQSGESTTFTSKASVCQYFGAQANLSANYGVFSGEFEVAFSEVSHELSEYYLGLLAIRSKNYKLRLQNANEKAVAASVVEDEDFKNLPESFLPDKPDNQQLFFAFFDKFGTHFVDEVDMGGRLDYYVYVNRAQVSNSQEFKAKLELEVKATFLSVGAEAEATWKKLTETWASSRKVRINATGSSSILNALVPGFNDNFHDQYLQWLVELRYTPMPVDLSLKPIYTIFSGKKAQALKEATEAYAGNSLTLNAPDDAVLDRTTGFINLNDAPLKTPTNFGAPGIRCFVLDQKTLAVKQDQIFPLSWNDINPEKIDAYAKALAILDPYQGKRDFIVGLLFWWVKGTEQYPSLGLQNLLKNLGAGASLDIWWSAHHSSSAMGLISYGIVGTFGGVGSGAVEMLAMHDIYTTRGLYLEAFLKPQYTGKEIRYVPS